MKYKVPATCPDCGVRGEAESDSPAVVHKTVLCVSCAAAGNAEADAALSRGSDYEMAGRVYDKLAKALPSVVRLDICPECRQPGLPPKAMRGYRFCLRCRWSEGLPPLTPGGS